MNQGAATMSGRRDWVKLGLGDGDAGGRANTHHVLHFFHRHCTLMFGSVARSLPRNADAVANLGRYGQGLVGQMRSFDLFENIGREGG